MRKNIFVTLVATSVLVLFGASCFAGNSNFIIVVDDLDRDDNIDNLKNSLPTVESVDYEFNKLQDMEAIRSMEMLEASPLCHLEEVEANKPGFKPAVQARARAPSQLTAAFPYARDKLR